MADCQGIIVINANGLGSHQIVAQCLLEFGRHEIVSGSRSMKNSKVDLEPEEIGNEWDDDQTNDSSPEVFPKLGKAQGTLFAVDVKQAPQVNCNRDSNRKEGKHADVFGGYDAAQGQAGGQEPLPPFAAERIVAILVELDVAQDAESHG